MRSSLASVRSDIRTQAQLCTSQVQSPGLLFAPAPMLGDGIGKS
jgi:hypothetical protein